MKGDDEQVLKLPLRWASPVSSSAKLCRRPLEEKDLLAFLLLDRFVLDNHTNMSNAILLHFGPAEVAHLAELKRTIPAAELEPVMRHWAGQSLNRYMHPLSSPARPPGSLKRTPAQMEQLRSEYKEAIRIRGDFCTLFTGVAPFFLQPSPDPQECLETVYLAQ